MKNLKRIFSLAAIVVLMVSVLSGCSEGETGFVSTYKKASTLKSYESDFKMNIKADKFKVGSDKDSKQIEDLVSVISKYSIYGTSRFDMDKAVGDISFQLSRAGTGKTSPEAKIIVDDRYVYVDIASMFDMISYVIENDSSVMELKTTDLAKIEKTRDILSKNAKYLKIDMADASFMNGQDIAPGPVNPMSRMGLKDSIKANDLYFRFIEGAQKEVFKTYTSDLTSKDGNGYSFEINSKNAPGVIIDIMGYVIDNADALEGYVSGFMNGMTESDFAVFGLSGDKDIAAAKQGAADTLKEIKKSKETFESQKGMLLKAMQDGSKPLDGTRYKLSIAEVSPGLFSQKQDLRIAVDMEPTAIDISLSSNTNIREVGGVSISVPSYSVDFKSIVDASARSVVISPQSGDYVFKHGQKSDSGNFKVFQKDGYNYVPLKQIADMFSDRVVYDSTNRVVRVVDEYGDSAVVNGGEIVGSTFYVRASQLRDLGYGVNWDGYKGSVEISKSDLEYLEHGLK